MKEIFKIKRESIGGIDKTDIVQKEGNRLEVFWCLMKLASLIYRWMDVKHIEK